MASGVAATRSLCPLLLLGLVLQASAIAHALAPPRCIAAAQPHACAAITMGVSRKKRAENAASAKAKKVTEAPAEGFGEKAEAAPPASSPAPDIAQPDIVREPTSMDAESMLSSDGTAAVAVNTKAAAASLSGLDPVFALDSAEVLSARVGSVAQPASYDAVLAALLAVPDGDDEAMAVFTQANRDLMDYRFMYYLTADKMLAENEGRTEQMERFDAARKRAVKACQRFDTPLFKQVGEAEGRLGGLLALTMQGKPPSAAQVVAEAGAGPQAHFAFWMVLLAAIAAWESKLFVPSVEDQARGKLAELAVLRAALEAEVALMEGCGVAPLLPLFALPDLSAVNEQRSAADADAARSLFAQLEDPTQQLILTRRIGCIYCQAQRHGFQAYNPFVQRSAALQDILLHGRLLPLSGRDIKAATLANGRPISSRIIKMSNDADPIVRESGVEIPLFW